MDTLHSLAGRDGGYKTSVGLETLAIFGIVSFIIRIAVDIAQRVRNGRSLEQQQSSLGGLTLSILPMLSATARLYDLYPDTH